ncbi:TetR/AcrR family transcriptional regulator [Pseudonocardia sichuanensis]|uniref:TetR family transcriptional regulator n=1 Tax=Pseudonocardia kunmingensis TaxID=630975 RepID=A0A543E2J0_9PSEU|nr:TetR/AcrR family transcriptional regulator [Pseudonocardia kunmingensis]TQM15807.1 TetR family transcriptional regulator [Pseudonocardia kunmingensis]
MESLRADARRNRAQIVDAAGALFAERGPDVPMEEIARRARVGVGTLYRRFPDRDALVRAVAIESFHRVVANARAAADEPDGWSGLTRFVRASVTDLRLATWLSMWFARTWADLRVDREQQELRADLLELLDDLVGRAQREGAMRPEVGVGDLAVLLALVLRPLPGPLAAVTEQAVERHVAVVLDGLRPGGEPLPGRPLTRESLLTSQM